MSRAQPLRPKKSDTQKPNISYEPLPKRPPRKLDYEGCENCRKAKKKCIMDNFEQPSRCSLCHMKGLLCPGPKRARRSMPVNTGISSSVAASSLANFVIDTSSIATVAPSLSIEQLKAQSCLTCNALGLSCVSEYPGEAPCFQCLHAAGSYILQSRLCIRATSFEDVSIFLSYLPDYQTFKSLWNEVQHLKISKFVFRINEVSPDFIEAWVSPETIDEIMGLRELCSASIIRLTQEHVPQQVALLFQLMICGTVSSYIIRNHDSFLGAMLLHLGTFAGHQVLKYLDSELNPRRLSNASLEKRQILFSLVHGTIIATRYTRRTCLHQELASANPTSEALWDKLREHLREMLAHHLAILIMYIGIRLSKDEENWFLRHSMDAWSQQKPEFSHLVLHYRGSAKDIMFISI